ncbi:glycosyl hydrolase [Aspergillus lucknowensis]|uniref:Glycosyl hydrolase n=1 Tax=Aspergillus lucknowensis TaxID=176173 RepID=A0ABR4LNJ5_9EURO
MCKRGPTTNYDHSPDILRIHQEKHSDPSCTRVDDTFFCTTSTFIAFPGLPVYASKDLINWRLISHAWSREAQLPGVSWNTTGQQDGMFAPTLRYHNGEFFLICEYLGIEGGIIGVVFRTTDPFDDDPWSDPVIFHPNRIDPDLFRDDDGKVYTVMQGIILQELDLKTGELSQPPTELWNGTGGASAEGPHIYKRDGWYYLLIAEGGSTVGHGDLFADADGNWWGLSLATRSGPEYEHYPMGREAVLFAASWEEGHWPVLQPVRGRMEGWPLPRETRRVPGDGPFSSDPDHTTDKGLEIVPSRNNLTGVPYSESDIVLTGKRGLSFISRRQTHTLFDFSVDLSFSPSAINQEAGITVFLTPLNHIDLGLVLLQPGNDTAPSVHLRMRAEGTGTPPPEKVVRVPKGWAVDKPMTLHITAEDPKSYTLSASLGGWETLEIGKASSALVSGGHGSFVGSLLGTYATCNGEGSGVECPKGGVATFQRWRYTPVAQFIEEDESVPA